MANDVATKLSLAFVLQEFAGVILLYVMFQKQWLRNNFYVTVKPVSLAFL